MDMTLSYNSSHPPRLLCLLIFFSSLSTTCANIQTRIVGGEDALIEHFPYMTHLKIYKGVSRVNCGGTYIGAYWVLTAAHCLYSSATHNIDLVEVLMGVTNRHDLRNSHRQIRYSSKTIKHPRYKKTKRPTPRTGYDVGLIKLKEPFAMAQRVRLAELPLTKINYSGLHVIAIGWGRLDPDSKVYPDTLQMLRTTVWDENRKCARIPERPICIGAKRKHASYGDSGAPLVLNGTVIGVLSHGTRKSKAPRTVFENVYSHLGWILLKTTVSRGAIYDANLRMPLLSSTCTRWTKLITFVGYVVYNYRHRSP